MIIVFNERRIWTGIKKGSRIGLTVYYSLRRHGIHRGVSFLGAFCSGGSRYYPLALRTPTLKKVFLKTKNDKKKQNSESILTKIFRKL